jgi:hypothetical protein
MALLSDGLTTIMEFIRLMETGAEATSELI